MKKSILFIIFVTLALTGCNRDLPTNEHILMLSVKNVNWGLVNTAEDYYLGSTRDVYYDGQVEFASEYNLSGITDENTYELNETELAGLYNVLMGKFKRYDEDYESACDGMGWKFYFYDEDGNLIHEYRGYIYENETMQEIVEMLRNAE